MTENDPITTLISLLARLPGIGEKTASRLAYFILRSQGEYAFDLAEAIKQMKEQIVFCSVCRNLTQKDPCGICADQARDKTTVLVVEEPHDLWAVEKSGCYKGLYHVLHGTLAPMKNQGPEDIELTSLVQRIKQQGIKEIILGTNPNPEGEATANYLAEVLSGIPVKVTRIARGIPVGGDLEYVDSQSLDQAIRFRREL